MNLSFFVQMWATVMEWLGRCGFCRQIKLDSPRIYFEYGLGFEFLSDLIEMGASPDVTLLHSVL